MRVRRPWRTCWDWIGRGAVFFLLFSSHRAPVSMCLIMVSAIFFISFIVISSSPLSHSPWQSFLLSFQPLGRTFSVFQQFLWPSQRHLHIFDRALLWCWEVSFVLNLWSNSLPMCLEMAWVKTSPIGPPLACLRSSPPKEYRKFAITFSTIKDIPMATIFLLWAQLAFPWVDSALFSTQFGNLHLLPPLDLSVLASSRLDSSLYEPDLSTLQLLYLCLPSLQTRIWPAPPRSPWW